MNMTEKEGGLEKDSNGGKEMKSKREKGVERRT